MGQYFSSSAISSDDSNDVTPLLQPAIEGRLDEIKQKIGEHIVVSSGNDGTENEASPSFRTFVNSTDSEGNSAVHGAAFAGHLDIVRFLVEKCGADYAKKNGLGCSPIWIAAGYGRSEILQYLIDQASIDNSSNNSGVSVTDLVSAENNTGDTPLLAAASRGHHVACQILLESANNVEKGGSVSGSCHLLCAKNKSGDTPLSVAVGASHSGPLLKMLLDWEMKLDIESQEKPINTINSKGLTPLIVACERDDVQIVKELIRRGALPTGDCYGKSPLAVSVFCGCTEVVEELLKLEFGKKLLNTCDKTGSTPLWLAARTGNVKMVKTLLEAGADKSISNKEGITPQQAAEQFQKQAVVDFFHEIENRTK